MTKTLKSLGKHSYWPWQNTFLFNILSACLAPSCIFVQRREYLRLRNVKIFRQNGSVTRKSQVCWPLTVRLKMRYAATFYHSHSKYGIRSLNTQHFQSYYSGKMFLWVKEILILEQLTESLCEYSYGDIVPTQICCTVRETVLRENINMS